MTISEQWKGVGFVLGADALWALSGSMAKYLFNQHISPFHLVQIRLTLSALILAVFLAVTRPALLKIERSDLRYLLIFGIFGMALVQFTYLFTISETNVSTAVFLQYLAPAFVVLYETVAWRQELRPVKAAALVLALVGGLLILKGPGGWALSVTPIGLASGLTSAAAFGFYIVYGKYGLSRYHPLTLLVWGLGLGALAWAIARPPWLLPSFSTRDWLFFLYIAVFATIIPFGLFFKGLNHLTPAVTGITSMMEPVLAGLFAFVLLNEVLSLPQLAGCALIIAGVLIIQQTGNPTETTAPPNA
ncbi:MAG: EamA family transporter [Solirubrobacterales bacterium]